MSAATTYSGQAYSPAGDKGRFVLPPDFRNAIKDNAEGAKTLCIARHHEWPCLVGFDIGRESKLEEQLAYEAEMAVRAGDPFDREKRRMNLFSFRKVPFDDSGRFIMPEALRKRAKIEAGLYFNGMGTFFTIWAPEMLRDLGNEFEDVLMDCEDAMAEAEAKSRKRGG